MSSKVANTFFTYRIAVTTSRITTEFYRRSQHCSAAFQVGRRCQISRGAFGKKGVHLKWSFKLISHQLKCVSGQQLLILKTFDKQNGHPSWSTPIEVNHIDLQQICKHRRIDLPACSLKPSSMILPRR